MMVSKLQYINHQPAKKVSPAKFLDCYNFFQSASILKIGENVKTAWMTQTVC